MARLISHSLHSPVRTDTRIRHVNTSRIKKLLGSHCEFPDTAARYRYSSWPTATTRQHRKFRAVNEQRDISKTKGAETQKIRFIGILNFHARNVFFYFASFKKATDLQFELQPTSPPSVSSVHTGCPGRNVPDFGRMFLNP